MYVEKREDGTFLLVTKRYDENIHRKLKGGPRRNFMVSFSDSKYFTAKRRLKVYAYPHIDIGKVHISCPEELAGKRVQVRLEVIELPDRRNKNGRRKERRKKT